jgi:hypothetical protein
MLVLLAAPASAQAYPPGNCNVTVGDIDLGVLNSNTTIVFAPTCVFQPGVSVDVTINNITIPDRHADGSGIVNLHITNVINNTIVIDGHPVHVPVVCGVNTALVKGFSRVANTHVTHHVRFHHHCPPEFKQPIPKAQPGKVAFTGANIVRWSLLALGALLVGGFLVGTTKRRARKADVVEGEREHEFTKS